MDTTTEQTTTNSLSLFKELVESIEQSKTPDEYQEFRSEEELNSLKQTSSLVAKFQKEALDEKQNRVSAELQAQEKDRLASDAWRIITALKKDKYSLELQVEKLKSEKDKVVRSTLGSEDHPRKPMIAFTTRDLNAKRMESLDGKKNLDLKEALLKESLPSCEIATGNSQEVNYNGKDPVDEDTVGACNECTVGDDVINALEAKQQHNENGKMETAGEVYERKDHIENTSKDAKRFETNREQRISDGIKSWGVRHHPKGGTLKERPTNEIHEPTTEMRSNVKNHCRFDKNSAPSDLITIWAAKPRKERNPITQEMATMGEQERRSTENNTEMCSSDGDLASEKPPKTLAAKPVRAANGFVKSGKPETDQRRRVTIDGMTRNRVPGIYTRDHGQNDGTRSSLSKPGTCEGIVTNDRKELKERRATIDPPSMGRESIVPNRGFVKSDENKYLLGRNARVNEAKTAGDSRKAVRERECADGMATKPARPLLRRSLPVNNKLKKIYKESCRGKKDILNKSTKAALEDILRNHINANQQERTQSAIENKDFQCVKADVGTPRGLPGGIVGKRIQDLAKRLKIGHSTVAARNDDRMQSANLRDPCPGLCGLENLGNSCFMNAGLQCLLVVKPFHRFFLSGGHKNRGRMIFNNQRKPRVSELLGQLMEKVWSGCYLTCEPAALFKYVQSAFPQLAGFNQHDCQEFLALFLDALHQELNTAKTSRRKSVTRDAKLQAKDADDWWRMYTERNESVIVDTFQGQLRNKITCSVCGHVSVTHQAFSFLSLPLASQQLQTFIVTLVRHSDENRNTETPRALRLRVQVNKPSTALQIKRSLVTLFAEDVQPDLDTLMLAVVRDGAVVGVMHDERVVSLFKDKQSKLYAFEPLPPSLLLVAPNINSKDDNIAKARLRPNRNQNATGAEILTHNATVSSTFNTGSKKGFASEAIQSHAQTRNNASKGAGGRREGDVTNRASPSQARGRRITTSYPVGYHLTHTCSFCLEDRTNRELLTHDECGRMFCRQCLGISVEDNADGINCPVCNRRSSTGRNTQRPLRYHNVPVLFRHYDPIEEGESILFGHPDMATLPERIRGQDLYKHLASLLPVYFTDKKKKQQVKALPFTLHLVSYEGQHCSRCTRSKGCTGCCITGNDVIDFQTGDHIAIHLTNLTGLDIDKMSRFSDHDSMRTRNFFSCSLLLQDCLKSFVDREELQDLWPCPQCNKERSATKSLAVCRYPDTLIIHLKRYSQSNQKITAPVEFPLEDLDMREYMHGSNSPRDSGGGGDYVYDLMGCVCHEGDYDGGHYKAYTRHGNMAEWCLFDDYTVSKECPSSSSHKTVYILFYNRRAGSPLSTSGLEAEVPAQRSEASKEKGLPTGDNKTTGAALRVRKSVPGNDEVKSIPTAVSQPKPSWNDMIELIHNSTSTPKKKHKEKKICDKEKDGTEPSEEVIIRPVNQKEEPMKCDCSQCDYLRELEQQLKRSRVSLGGAPAVDQTKHGAMPGNNKTPTRTGGTPSKQGSVVPSGDSTPTKRVTPHEGASGRRPRNPRHRMIEKSPPLASSDSLGSDLFAEPDYPTKQSKKSQFAKPGDLQPTSSSSEEYTSEIHVRSEGNVERFISKSPWKKVVSLTRECATATSSESVESAVQCTIMDHYDAGDYRNSGPSFRDYHDMGPRDRTGVNSGVHVTLLERETSRNENTAERISRAKDNRQRGDISVESAVTLLTRKLMCAVENKNIKRALQLIKKGADPSLLIDGVSVLHIAVGMMSSLAFHFARLFLDFGADPNVKSIDGLTPVHVAAMWGKKECLKLLLSKGGNPYKEDHDGLNAIELAKAFECDTSADTSEYLTKLDEHYSYVITSDSLSNISLFSDISTSELQYMPYLHGEGWRGNIPEFLIPTPVASPESTVPQGCGSWAQRARKRVKKTKLARRVSGNLRTTSSNVLRRLRSFGEYLSSSSSSSRQ